MNNIIVIYTVGSLENSTDNYQVFETIERATEFYNETLEMENILISSITGVLQSTDYDTFNF